MALYPSRVRSSDLLGRGEPSASIEVSADEVDVVDSSGEDALAGTLKPRADTIRHSWNGGRVARSPRPPAIARSPNGIIPNGLMMLISTPNTPITIQITKTTRNAMRKVRPHHDWTFAKVDGCDDISGLTVELSGAHAGVWAWHFILHASARAIC